LIQQTLLTTFSIPRIHLHSSLPSTITNFYHIVERRSQLYNTYTWSTDTTNHVQRWTDFINFLYILTPILLWVFRLIGRENMNHGKSHQTPIMFHVNLFASSCSCLWDPARQPHMGDSLVRHNRLGCYIPFSSVAFVQKKKM
jgi:hypothetical protein